MYSQYRAIVVLYNQIVVLLLSAAPLIASLTLFATLGVAIVIVVFNIMSIKMYAMLPFNIYMLGPTFSIILILIMNMVLKSDSHFEVRTKEMLRRWRNDPNLVAWGVLKEQSRRVAAMRPILIYMGIWRTHLLSINIKFVCQYNSFIVDGTITVLLTYM